MTIFFGLGGGSDLATCRVLALSMRATNARFITSFRPLRSDNMIDLENTILKYTGFPYMQNGIRSPGRNEYNKFTAVRSNKHEVYFKNTEHNEIVGILLDRSEDCQMLYHFNRNLLKQFYTLDSEKEIIAVDTGGDSLRGLVPGMGDRDISDLFDGTRDDRDRDALLLTCEVVRGPVTLYVVGPGSDGETTQNGLKTAYDWTRKHQEALESPCRFKHRGRIASFRASFPSVDEWSSPTHGSTIRNIMNAQEKSCEDQVSIVRRGKHVDHIQAHFLQEYWVFECRFDGSHKLDRFY